MKRILKIISIICLIYFIYVIFTVIILPNYYPKEVSNCCDYEEVVNDFYGEDLTHPDKITLIDNGKALSVRINLIENAQEIIEISQFYINNDKVGNIFLAELLEAADRGVKVRIIVDGKYNKISGFTKENIYALIVHPNIELKLYEPFKLFKPWTINNFLHDKILIIDSKYGLISGRNIGNRYFLDDTNKYTYDLDTIITYTGNTEDDYKNSSINQLKDYFTYMWNHRYTIKPKKINIREKNKGKASYQKLINNLDKYREKESELFNIEFNWEEISVPTKNITLVYNPLNRLNKKPKVWCTIAHLINNANSKVFINSPYIVPTKEIANKLDSAKISDLEINVLTNSAGSTPNIFAFSGYLRYKEKMLSNNNINIYEYQGEGSLHSKTYIIDDRISIVGSYNLDPRSTFLSTESMLVVDSNEFTELLNTYYEKQINYSLLTNGLYSYENNDIDPAPVPLVKKATLTIMRYVVRLIDHLV